MNIPTKDPRLQCKYANGLGDLVACVLHSKFLGWLTKLITGKNEPCQVCSVRKKALNVLVPFKFWRLFFKTDKEYVTSLVKDLEDSGYMVDHNGSDSLMYGYSQNLLSVAPEEQSIPVQRSVAPEEQSIPVQSISIHTEENIPDGYKLFNSGETQFDNYIIKTQIFKLKS